MSLSSNQQRFAQWLAVPRRLRTPKTQKELADLLDVCPDTLSRWKKDPDFQTQVYTLAHERLENILPDVLGVIIENAMAGNYQFVKLILELTDKYSSKITVQGSQPQLGIERHAAMLKQIEIWQAERAAGGDHD